ncbi:MAG: hypothetical protein QMC98_00750 [Candidatus Thermoplasmatota archaeon]|nr:hypothetical protein [Candidatus Thermoplasmatota archaeon]
MIKACLKCGSKNLHGRTISDGLIPRRTDTLGILVCGDCNYQGIPITFYTEELSSIPTD